MAAGDLLFYRSDGSLFDRLIAAGTHGPFVHVEVDCGDGTSIGALAHGVTRHPRPTPAAVAAIGAQLAYRSPKRFAAAIAWLDKQVGRQYSWLDIAGDALKALVPWPTPFLVMPSAFDCSALAATFLTLAGAELPPELVTDLARVSPNDLGHALLPLLP